MGWTELSCWRRNELERPFWIRFTYLISNTHTLVALAPRHHFGSDMLVHHPWMASLDLIGISLGLVEISVWILS